MHDLILLITIESCIRTRLSWTTQKGNDSKCAYYSTATVDSNAINPQARQPN